MNEETQFYIDTSQSVWNYSLLNESLIHQFQSGTLTKAYQYFGAHKITVLNQVGFHFSVWAPNASVVSVVGDFNQWNARLHPLRPRLDRSGIWEGFIPGLEADQTYKYHITTPDGRELLKADPYTRYAELRPATASKTHHIRYNWKDGKWMKQRKKHNALQSPWNVYELHLGSWMRPDKYNENSFNDYRTLADLLVPYVKDMGFTHVEFMPLTEYPYDKSWGYQCTGYFAATSRYGRPEDLMYLIDQLHQNNIGVILDWVPSHFPGDAHGLYLFDGAHTYEYADMRKGYHPDWNSYIFNYKRGEVVSFLLSSAHFWFDLYHIDGIRVDAVNSIIRLDFSRQEGGWEPNERGTNENLEAIDFLKQLNRTIYQDFPDVQTIAEEASDWPDITTPVHMGGLGFGMKWMMGWMHDTFRYFKTGHFFRPYIQDTITFSIMYFTDENFMLPLSHDEVVHGKSPMIYKMQGLEYQKFANLRALYAYMYMHPGAKLLFMGNEFAQTSEWNETSEIDWHLLEYVSHQKMKDCVKDLCHLYRSEPACYEYPSSYDGFQWVETNKRNECLLAFMRKGKQRKNDLFVVMNLSDQMLEQRTFKLEGKSNWREILNTNDIKYWGTGEGLNPVPEIRMIQKKNRVCEIKITIPPLSVLIFK